MDNSMKYWLLVAAFLILLGMAFLVAAMYICNWDLSGLGTTVYESETYEFSGNISDISIQTDTADIVFAAAADGKTKVVCLEQNNLKHNVLLQDGKLTILPVDERNWYDHIGINFGHPQITVYLPEEEYGCLSVTSDTADVTIPKDFSFHKAEIRASTGKITVEDITVGELDVCVSTGTATVANVTCEKTVNIDVTTGKVKLMDIQCENLVSTGSTGDLLLERVMVTETISVERNTGNVKFEECDAGELMISTTTGDVTGSFLSEKRFIAETSTGRIDVPQGTNGGNCCISTNTGDIRIKLSSEA